MTDINLTQGYQSFIEDIKTRILSSRYQAARAVNKELILLYHHIGTQILEKQKAQGWGAKVIEHLSKDLKMAFPEMRGFGTQNLKYMKRFAETYTDNEFGQQSVDQLGWGHLIILIYQVPTSEERQWYIQKTIQEGWSKCLVPENYGVYYEESDTWRKGLWDKYYMEMPEQRRQSVERYVIAKKA